MEANKHLLNWKGENDEETGYKWAKGLEGAQKLSNKSAFKKLDAEIWMQNQNGQFPVCKPENSAGCHSVLIGHIAPKNRIKLPSRW